MDSLGQRAHRMWVILVKLGSRSLIDSYNFDRIDRAQLILFDMDSLGPI